MKKASNINDFSYFVAGFNSPQLHQIEKRGKRKAFRVFLVLSRLCAAGGGSFSVN